MNQRIIYLLASLIGSVVIGVWIYHLTAPSGTAAASIDIPPRPRAEIVRVPASTEASVASQPTTGPATALASRPTLPREYAILQARNPFARGGKIARAGAAGGPETMLILRGVADGGEHLIAFFEDQAAKRVVQLAAGEAVASGKIISMNLDGIEYQGVGPSRQIKVGQDLNGQAAPPTPTSKPAGPLAPGAGQAPGQEGQPGQPPEQPPGPNRSSGKRAAKVPG
jgi:hypothetical protein